jgi:hypothetical protein
MSGFEKLIDQLAANLKPVPRYAVPVRLLTGIGIGIAVSAVLVLLVLGVRSDISEAITSDMFWVKIGYTLAVLFFSLSVLERIARPGEVAGRRPLFIWGSFLAIAVPAAVQFMLAPVSDRATMVMGGGSAGFCILCIMALAFPPFAGIVWAVRTLAPTDFGATGLGVGLAAGGAGACVYAIHCVESSVVFLAIWYTLGVVLVAALGWSLGPALLRWPRAERLDLALGYASPASGQRNAASGLVASPHGKQDDDASLS